MRIKYDKSFCSVSLDENVLISSTVVVLWTDRLVEDDESLMNKKNRELCH